MHKFLAIFITVFASLAHAGSSAKISLDGADLQIISTGTPRVYIYNVPIEGCSGSTTSVLLLGGEEENPLGKELYSALLMAKASGKEVKLQSTGCWYDGTIHKLTSMYIND